MISSRKSAFTLVELLVVIGAIAILAALLLPALFRAKVAAWGAVCLNNKKQLNLAWTLYTHDNEGWLAPNIGLGPDNGGYFMNPTSPALAQPGVFNWIWGSMDWYAESSFLFTATNSSHLVDPRYALFARYISSWQTYKCPADRYLSPEQRAAGWSVRVRSVSMNMYMGGMSYFFRAGRPDSSPWSMTWYSKETDLRNLPPAQAIVFIDQHPDSIAIAQFPMGPPESMAKARMWGALPASYHNGGAAVGFADNHAEIKRWLVPATLQPVTFQKLDATVSHNTDTTDPRDVLWVWQHMTAPKN